MTTKSNKPVILLAFANDLDNRVRYLRKLAVEARSIQSSLSRAKRDGLCEVIVRQNATADDIFSVFKDPDYRDRIAIFHYGGHANGYQLLMESADGQTKAAHADGFAAFLSEQQHLQLVFLNGCSTEPQVDGLLGANVPAVIATSTAIDDSVAADFATRFYESLAGGASIQKSYNEAEAEIRTSVGDQTRAVFFGDATKKASMDTSRWPWELQFKAGAETVADWNLPEEVGDPLFGLPPVPTQDLPLKPFRHLHYFEREHADVFFGRGHKIRELYELVTDPYSSPIVLLYGQSGVGKSSLLAAGLAPRLSATHEIRYVRRDQELGLLASIKIQLMGEEYEAKNLDSTKSIRLQDDWHDLEKKSNKPALIIVDQIEECWTRPNPQQPQELAEFLNEVRGILSQRANRPRGRLILGFRKEWLADIEPLLDAQKLHRAKVFLERLGRRGIIEAVRGPTLTARLQRQYGLSVEEGLPEAIADDLLKDEDSALAPTLQILLTKMWDQATQRNQSKPVFDQQHYRQLQRDGILLEDFLNEQIDKLRKWRSDVVDSGLVLDLLSFHTTPLGTAAMKSSSELPVAYSHREEILEDLIQQCKRLYLLVDPSENSRTATAGTRLAHDTLAPLVRARFDESDKPGQRARRILENRAVDWKDEQQGTPLDPQDLQLVEEGRQGTRALGDVENRLLQASREARAKRMRMQRILKVAGGVAIAIIIVLAGVALWKWKSESKLKIAAKQTAEALSDIVKMRDKYVEAMKLTEEGKKVLALKKLESIEQEQKSQHEEHKENQQLSSITKLHRSDILVAIANVTGDSAERDKMYQEAIEIRFDLVDALKKSNKEWPSSMRKLASAYTGLALVQENLMSENKSNFDAAQKHFDDAKKYYERAESTRKEILDAGIGSNEELETRRESGDGYLNLMGLYEKLAYLEGDDEADPKLRDWLTKVKDPYEHIESNANAAIEDYDFVLKTEKNNSEVAYTRAQCLFSLAKFVDTKKYSEAYKNALMLARDRSDVTKYQEFRDEIESTLKLYIESYPEEPAYKVELAQIFKLAEKPKEARKLVDEILKRWPDHAPAVTLKNNLLNSNSTNR